MPNGARDKINSKNCKVPFEHWKHFSILNTTLLAKCSHLEEIVGKEMAECAPFVSPLTILNKCAISPSTSQDSAFIENEATCTMFNPFFDKGNSHRIPRGHIRYVCAEMATFPAEKYIKTL